MRERKKVKEPKDFNKEVFTPERIKKLVNVIHGLRLRTEAHSIVDTFDELMLYSEKIRRIMIRVKVRSNRACKKAGLKMMRKFVALCH